METLNRNHILIVEDSKDLQDLLSQLLKSEGYNLSNAYNGKEALELLNSMRELPALILLDIMMPVMGGLEFRKEQSKNPKISQIPVVVMTADSNSQATVEKLGAADFIKKPISDVNKFLDSVGRHLKN